MPTERMVPPPGASPPMRMTASWSGLTDPTAYKSVCGTKLHPMASSPRIINGGTAQMPKLCKKPRRSSSSLACSGLKRCETQASLGGKPPSFATFRSLDPFRALRELDRRRRDEERLSRSEQRTANKPKYHLTGKAPYRFESCFLQRRVGSELGSDRPCWKRCAASWRSQHRHTRWR